MKWTLQNTRSLIKPPSLLRAAQFCLSAATRSCYHRKHKQHTCTTHTPKAASLSSFSLFTVNWRQIICRKSCPTNSLSPRAQIHNHVPVATTLLLQTAVLRLKTSCSCTCIFIAQLWGYIKRVLISQTLSLAFLEGLCKFLKKQYYTCS